MKLGSPELVTWAGSDTVLGNVTTNGWLTVQNETWVATIVPICSSVTVALARNLRTSEDFFTFSKVFAESLSLTKLSDLHFHGLSRRGPRHLY